MNFVVGGTYMYVVFPRDLAGDFARGGIRCKACHPLRLEGLINFQFLKGFFAMLGS